MITHPSKLTNLQLHNQFKFVITRERKILHLVIIHIQEIAKRSYYLEKYESLQKYLEKEFGYSHTAAQRRIDAARLANVSPSVAQKIETGELNLSQLNVVSNAIKQKEKLQKSNLSMEAKAHLIEQVEKTTVFQTQQICAEFLDLPIIEAEKIKIQKDHSARFEITLSAEQMHKLEQVKGLIAQKHLSLKRTMCMSDVLETCFDLIIEKKLGAEPVKKTQSETASVSKRVTGASVAEEKPEDGTMADVSGSKPWKSITPKRRQWVFRKFQSCQHKHQDSAEICGSRFQLEVEHLKPKWAGGDDRMENLTLLCRNHNQFKYRQQAGFSM